ncbi:hypothetical protein EG68_11738 [Paragonimus skrjabini miyazakii]|uniref:Uncharacterized protein n=1 Tax=Paragonimus skrjabini miyazakii TaxID=59628 RepID=A0A8S9YH22_9TREM|nr:hypothetical protein EG68_11738 [Paragonimus skrjabini miyazakii]
MGLPHHISPRVKLLRSDVMNEGVNEDLAMSVESSISDDLCKAFLQLGTPLAWQSVILMSSRSLIHKYRRTPEPSFTHLVRAGKSALELGCIFILDWNGPSIVN